MVIKNKVATVFGFILTFINWKFWLIKIPTMKFATFFFQQNFIKKIICAALWCHLEPPWFIIKIPSCSTFTPGVSPQVKLQDIVFRSEGGANCREAKSRITVYQNPSTHEYMGKLLSNKQVRLTPSTSGGAGENPGLEKLQNVNQCSQLSVGIYFS